MRGWRALTALGLLAATFAGCLGGEDLDLGGEELGVDVPEERFSDYRVVALDFTAGDGTSIAAHTYLPEGASEEARFGTIVNFSPYYGNLYGIDTDGRLDAVSGGDLALNQSSTGMFVAHGFAYVAASVPGTGKSGGCFEIGGGHEQEVMAEFIDWVGERDWSNGKVGMHGASYDGTTQWMVAVQAPEHLATVVPWVSITDFYEYEYQDGAPYAWWGPFFLPYYLLEVGWGLNPYGNFLSANPEPDLLLEDACPQALDQFTQTGRAYATGVYTDFWQERNYADRMDEIEASVFMIHGLQDWNVKPLHLDVWDQIPTEKFAWFQQMQHNVPYANSYNEDWARDDYNATLLAWYDHYLNGVENGVPEALPPVWVQDDTGHWRNETAWPPEDVNQTRWFLGDGTLERGPTPEGETRVLTPPSWPSTEPTNDLFGPEGQPEVVAEFVSDELEGALRISGVPLAELNVTVDRPGYAHLVAQLYALHPDGEYEFLDMGGRGMAQRDGRERDDPVVPLEPMTVPVELNPTETYLEAGSRLVLLVSAGDPDWFHYNGNNPTVWVDHSSTLVLPLLSDDAPRGVPAGEVKDHNPFYTVDQKEF